MMHLETLLAGPAAPFAELVALPQPILREDGGLVSRAVLTAALNLHLLAGLLERVRESSPGPSAQLEQRERAEQCQGQAVH